MPLELFGFSIVPLIIGLVEVTKRVGVPSRDAPVIAILLGLAAGFGVEYATPQRIWMKAVVYGIAYGLAASGIYSAVAKYVTTPASSTPSADPAPTDPTQAPVPPATSLIPPSS